MRSVSNTNALQDLLDPCNFLVNERRSTARRRPRSVGVGQKDLGLEPLSRKLNLCFRASAIYICRPKGTARIIDERPSSSEISAQMPPTWRTLRYFGLVLESGATSERQRRSRTEAVQRRRAKMPSRDSVQRRVQRDEIRAKTLPRCEQRKRQQRGTEPQRRKGAEAKTGRVSTKDRNGKHYPEGCLGALLLYIGSGWLRGARGDGSHVHTKRDAHLAPLTPLVGAAHASSYTSRACETTYSYVWRIESAPRNEWRGTYKAPTLP